LLVDISYIRVCYFIYTYLNSVQTFHSSPSKRVKYIHNRTTGERICILKKDFK
jgi:hypothetical protein